MMERCVAWAFLSILASTLLTVLYFWFIDPPPVVTQKDAYWYDWKNINRDQFKAGELANISRYVCVSKSVWATSSRALVRSDDSIRVPLIQGGGPWVGCSTVVSSVIIPPGVPPGHYRLEVKLLVETNLLRSDQIVVNSPSIDIVE